MEPRKNASVHQCQHCSSTLVQPLEWSRLNDFGWQVTLRCPECWETYTLILDQEDVNDFSYYLENAFTSLLETIEELDQEAFESDCECFIIAVWENNILPMDF